MDKLRRRPGGTKMNPLIERLTAKGVVVTEYENRGEQAREEWKNCFVLIEERSQYRPYLWEYLVEEMDGCLVGKEADVALRHTAKWKCLLFFEHSNDVLELELSQAQTFVRKDLTVAAGDYADVYIVDPAYTWTYVIPHEADWGPYFLIKSTMKRG
ncbi:DUF4275 family protein [Exiguobacterium sp. SH0S1]|nr:DUF4275 family protein [Exiguobacterium sp. SH0S1]